MKRVLDPSKEISLMKTLARDLWMTERARLVVRDGPGFARFSDKRSAGMMRVVVENLLLAGATWIDIEHGVISAASDPRAGPWSVFDHALSAMSAREDEFRIGLRHKMEAEIRERDPRPVERVNRGLRAIGDIVPPYDPPPDRPGGTRYGP